MDCVIPSKPLIIPQNGAHQALIRSLLIAMLAASATSLSLAEDGTSTGSVAAADAKLIVVGEWQDATGSVAVTDETKTLDEISWEKAAPFLVRGYKLAPGPYRIFVNGVYEGEIQLVTGGTKYINFQKGSDGQDLQVATGATPLAQSSALFAQLRELSDGGGEPVTLEPAGDTLYFNTEPPFEIPKPPGTEPKP